MSRPKVRSGIWPVPCRRSRKSNTRMLDDAQAATVDRIEAGQRVSGTVRLALEVSDSDSIARRLVAAGAEHVAPPVTTPWGSKRPGPRPRRHAADALHPTVRVRSSPPVLALRVKPAALTGECASCGGRSDRRLEWVLQGAPGSPRRPRWPDP